MKTPGWSEEIVDSVQKKWPDFAEEVFQVIRKHYDKPADGILATTILLATLSYTCIRGNKLTPEGVSKYAKVCNSIMVCLEWSWDRLISAEVFGFDIPEEKI